MSGGAFSYIHRKDIPTYLSTEHRCLRDMIGFLYCRDEYAAASHLKWLWNEIDDRGYDADLSDLEERWEDLMFVLRAAEWWASGDIGRELFQDKWESYTYKRDTVPMADDITELAQSEADTQ